MKEGAWINGRTFESFWIPEHALWIKNHDNAMKLGVPEETWEQIKDIPNDYSGPGRERILLLVMDSGPFIRMRGQGNLYAFEFMCATPEALWGVYVFAEKFAGDYTTLRFNNLRTKETIDITMREFKERMSEDERKVLRMAKVIPRMSRFATTFTNQLLQTSEGKGTYSKLARADKDKLDAFMQDFWNQTAPHPWDARERLWADGTDAEGKPQYKALFECRPFDGFIHLSSVRSLQQGVGQGRDALKWFCGLADKHGVPIDLTVEPIKLVDNKGKRIPTLNKSQLTAWYKRNGFVPKHYDHMTREPKGAVPSISTK